MLEVFVREFEVHATWATVGAVIYDTKRSLLRSLPTLRPSYRQGDNGMHTLRTSAPGKGRSAGFSVPSLVDGNPDAQQIGQSHVQPLLPGGGADGGSSRPRTRSVQRISESGRSTGVSYSANQCG